VFRKIRKIQDRMEGILAYLGEHAADTANPKSVDALLADAYQWFYQSGRYDFKADGEEGRFNYDLCTLKLFDVLLEGESVVAANVRIRNERAEAHRRAPHVLGTYATDSDVSVSPFFDESFKRIPSPLRGQVVERLKELAKTTNRPATSVQNHIKRSCKLKHGIPNVEVAPGVKLVIEFETVGVCFLGFLIAGTERRREGLLVQENSAPPMMKLVWLASCLVLLFTLVYVPYEVVLIGKGDNLRVFNGYDFVWSTPDISKICDWHTDETSTEPYHANRQCYSQVSLPRVLLGALAGFVPFFVTTLLMGVFGRRR
jgi:hypothetical protein